VLTLFHVITKVGIRRRTSSLASASPMFCTGRNEFPHFYSPLACTDTVPTNPHGHSIALGCNFICQYDWKSFSGSLFSRL